MHAERLMPLPLLVAGAALVVASVHAGPERAGAALSVQSAYVPPVTARSVELDRHVQVAPAQPRRHPHSLAVHPRIQARSAGRRLTRPVTSASAARRPVVRAASHVATPVVSGPTGWSALNAAIARIVTYRPGTARWVVSTKYDFWGTADWYHDVLYVDPSVPADKLFDVAVHEWSHELSVLDYGGDVAAATGAMNSTFGGSGLTGAERAADCMALLQGASWTHYTTCTDTRWRSAAARLVAGRKLA